MLRLLMCWSYNTLVCITQKNAKKVPVAIGTVNCKIIIKKIIIPRVGNSYLVKYLFDTMTLNQNQLQISCPLGTFLPVHVTGMTLVLRKMEE